MILRFTLVGAHHAESGPLEPKRLDVEVRVILGAIRLAPLRAKLTGTVHVEGLARSAEATGELRAASSGIHYCLDFAADDERLITLAFSQSFAKVRVTSRSLTELSGHLVARDDGTVLGRARLRLDVRRALGL